MVRILMSAVVALFCTANAVHAAITIDLVTVGDLGNANDTTGYGAVNYEYRIGKFEVTIGQYADFLNAVATSDPYSLYNTSMGTDLNIAGIARSGASGGYTYSVINNGGFSGNRPIAYVSWFDAARFANWMQNGQGTGSTETGAYTLNGATSGDAPARNEGALFFIPTENEWYKAAYYSPVLNSGSGGYYNYATQSDTAPGNVAGSGANQANYYTGAGYSVTQSSSYSSSQNYQTDVGVFTNSASHYGTFDQSGNAIEWTSPTAYAASSNGALRGGKWWATGAVELSTSFPAYLFSPSFEFADTGFRLAAVVPEPSTYAMALAALACGGYSMWRRRNRA